LAHALACLAIIVDAEAAGKLNDDRCTAGGYRKMVTALTPHVERLKQLHAEKNPKHYTIADSYVDQLDISGQLFGESQYLDRPCHSGSHCERLNEEDKSNDPLIDVMDAIGPGTNIWIRHNGNQDPTPAGSVVDLVLRNGRKLMAVDSSTVDWRRKKKNPDDVRLYGYTMVGES